MKSTGFREFNKACLCCRLTEPGAGTDPKKSPSVSPSPSRKMLQKFNSLSIRSFSTSVDVSFTSWSRLSLVRHIFTNVLNDFLRRVERKICRQKVTTRSFHPRVTMSSWRFRIRRSCGKQIQDRNIVPMWVRIPWVLLTQWKLDLFFCLNFSTTTLLCSLWVWTNYSLKSSTFPLTRGKKNWKILLFLVLNFPIFSLYSDRPFFLLLKTPTRHSSFGKRCYRSGPVWKDPTGREATEGTEKFERGGSEAELFWKNWRGLEIPGELLECFQIAYQKHFRLKTLIRTWLILFAPI